MKKTIDLQNIGLTATDLNTRNITDIPIEKMYYCCYGVKQIVIHQMQGKYYIYTMNFLPRYYREKLYKEYFYNKWMRLCGNKELNHIIKMFRVYLLEMIGEETQKKVTIQEVIEILKGFNLEEIAE